MVLTIAWNRAALLASVLNLVHGQCAKMLVLRGANPLKLKGSIILLQLCMILITLSEANLIFYRDGRVGIDLAYNADAHGGRK